MCAVFGALNIVVPQKMSVPQVTALCGLYMNARPQGELFLSSFGLNKGKDFDYLV